MQITPPDVLLIYSLPLLQQVTLSFYYHINNSF